MSNEHVRPDALLCRLAVHLSLKMRRGLQGDAAQFFAAGEGPEKLAVTPAYKEAVARLRGFRGLQTNGAMVLCAELGDLRRFGSPRHLMAYVGLVPSEHSSGSCENRGSIIRSRKFRSYGGLDFP